ncbi:hypothetical protein CBR_g21742 [Chara braunii]|uniref:Aspartic peptidase DDI1-type domain-containing protein n=1 Tax=Chara braunii TaxID=69332 RepID=A0A388L1I1_CHABU|nr:hypothetical protein CBR_g21742 [Chara braunii]|eukprot:GBG76082.1 hypothetical protein CBR_g21742 [Chara braunii]
MMTGPLTPQARLAQASQEPSRREPEPGGRKEAMKVKDDDDEEEEDERLRQEEDQRTKQRSAKKQEAREGDEPVLHNVPPKKKKYVVRLEETFDAEKVIDRLLEGHNNLMTLKEILASTPKLRNGLKGRLSHRLVTNVHLGTILPKEAEWAESGTKMDWKYVAYNTVDLVVKGSKCAAMVNKGAEMNIIREADAIRFGLDIDRSDSDILHGASCKAVFCGTASNVLIEVGKGQRIPRDDWVRMLPLWTRKVERPLARQIRDMARDWESCRAHLREAFRRPKPPLPRVERRQRSRRQKDPEPSEARPSRGGRKALARTEEESEPKGEERGAYPECGLGPLEFNHFTEGGLRKSPVRTQEEAPASEGPLRELEAHLDVSRWGTSPRGEERGGQAEEVPREEVPQEEARDTQGETRLGDEGRRTGKEVIEVGEDTPPRTPAVGLRLGDTPGSILQAAEGSQREEAPLPPLEKAPSPERRVEKRRETASVRREALALIDRHLAAHALEHPDLEEPTPEKPR